MFAPVMTRLGVQFEMASEDLAEDLDQATINLRRELLELGVDAVDRPPGEAPPPGARAVDPLALGKLVVTLGPRVVRAAVSTVRAVLARNAARSATVRIGNDEITIMGASADQQDR